MKWRKTHNTKSDCEIWYHREKSNDHIHKNTESLLVINPLSGWHLNISSIAPV